MVNSGGHPVSRSMDHIMTFIAFELLTGWLLNVAWWNIGDIRTPDIIFTLYDTSMSPIVIVRSMWFDRFNSTFPDEIQAR